MGRFEVADGRGMAWSRAGLSGRIVPNGPIALNVSRSRPVAHAVSKSQPVSDAESDALVETGRVNPLKNPSYPQRLHLHERAHWLGVLQRCEERLHKARQKLNVLPPGPNRAAFE